MERKRLMAIEVIPLPRGGAQAGPVSVPVPTAKPAVPTKPDDALRMKILRLNDTLRPDQSVRLPDGVYLKDGRKERLPRQSRQLIVVAPEHGVNSLTITLPETATRPNARA